MWMIESTFRKSSCKAFSRRGRRATKHARVGVRVLLHSTQSPIAGLPLNERMDGSQAMDCASLDSPGLAHCPLLHPLSDAGEMYAEF